jgi:O-antigen ligase
MLGALAVVPVTDKLIERFSFDFGRSVDERLEGTIAALKMYDDHNPLLGVGLNNYKAHMLDYQPEARWTLKYEDEAVHLLHVRFPVGPWNGFIMTLVETGIIGLAALMVYIARAHVLGLKAVATTRNPGHVRAASLGLLLGLAGVAGHQFTDHSFWEDPILYSFTLVVALVNSASIGLGSASAGAAVAPGAASGDVADLPPKANG